MDGKKPSRTTACHYGPNAVMSEDEGPVLTWGDTRLWRPGSLLLIGLSDHAGGKESLVRWRRSAYSAIIDGKMQKRQISQSDSLLQSLPISHLYLFSLCSLFPSTLTGLVFSPFFSSLLLPSSYLSSLPFLWAEGAVCSVWCHCLPVTPLTLSLQSLCPGPLIKQSDTLPHQGENQMKIVELLAVMSLPLPPSVWNLIHIFFSGYKGCVDYNGSNALTFFLVNPDNENAKKGLLRSY